MAFRSERGDHQSSERGCRKGEGGVERGWKIAHADDRSPSRRDESEERAIHTDRSERSMFRFDPPSRP